MVSYVGRFKYYLSGSKRYAAIFNISGRQKLLRRTGFRTATETNDYGIKVEERYRRLMDVHLSMMNEESHEQRSP